MSRKRLKRTNKHHRLSRSRTKGIPVNGNVCGIPNVVVVDYKKHVAFHKLFESTHPVDIACELNQYWVDPNYVMLALPREEAVKVIKVLSQLVH